MFGMGERLKEERKKLKMTQPFLANKLDTTKKSILSYEKSLSYPTAYSLLNMAKLGFDIQYIVTGVRSSMALSPEEQELLALYRVANDTLKLAAKATLATGAKGGHTVTVNGHLNVFEVK